MHKPTLYEFHDAVTTGAARQFLASEQIPGDNYHTVRDKLWILLDERRWSMAKLIMTTEGQEFFDSLATMAEEKVQQLSVDQQG
jgi:hypothetical protein